MTDDTTPPEPTLAEIIRPIILEGGGSLIEAEYPLSGEHYEFLRMSLNAETLGGESVFRPIFREPAAIGLLLGDFVRQAAEVYGRAYNVPYDRIAGSIYEAIAETAFTEDVDRAAMELGYTEAGGEA